MAATLLKMLLYTVLLVCPVIYSLEEDLFNDFHHRVRRAAKSVDFDINGKRMTFTFVLPSHQVYSKQAPVWLAKSKPGNSPNYTYELIENSGKLMNGFIYEDNDKKAVVLVHIEKNKILYDGVFGESKQQHVIESLPEARRTRTRSGRKNGDHVIYRSNSQTLYFPTPKHFKELFEQKLKKPLEVLYPKLLIVVDNHLFKKLGSNVAKTIEYVAIFWTKVNQKYLDIESPKVKILVTGIIIANDEPALNFIHQSTLQAERKNGSVADTLQKNTRLYFHNEFPKVMDFQNYDAAVVMTGQNTHGIGGQAYEGKICANWYNDAFVADDGKYYGINAGIHELGHLLNIKHDPLDKSECAGVTKDKSVSVMSPLKFDTDNFFWSKCSIKDLQDFAGVRAAECLRDQYRQRHYDENMAE